jgi:hypothetical protein
MLLLPIAFLGVFLGLMRRRLLAWAEEFVEE